MGLYPPGTSGAEKIPTKLQSGDLGPASPPFKVRDSWSINSELGEDALPNGFTAVPLMNVEANNPFSIRNEGCPIVDQFDIETRSNPATFSAYAEMTERLKEPIAKALELPEELMKDAGFIQNQDYTDIITCKQFEGLEMPWFFTEQTQAELHLHQAIYLGYLDAEITSLF